MTVGHQQPCTRSQVRLQRPIRRSRVHVVVAQSDQIGPPQQGSLGRWQAVHERPRGKAAQHPLPPDHDQRRVTRDDRPPVVDLSGHRGERPHLGVAPGFGHGTRLDGHTDRDRGLPSARRRLDVVKDGPLVQVHQHQVHTGSAQQVKLGCERGVMVHADDRRGGQSETRRRQCGIGHTATEPPAALIVRCDVA